MGYEIERQPSGTYSLCYDASNKGGWQRPWAALVGANALAHDGPMTPQEAFDHASDFAVSYEPISTQGGVTLEGYRAVIAERSWGKVPIGLVGMRHRHIQNDEVFSLLDDTGLMVDSAAVLNDPIIETDRRGNVTRRVDRGGRELYLQARMPDFESSIRLKNGTKDGLRQYLTARWGHCGQTSLVVGWATTRIVCSNTLAHATLESVNSEQAEEEGTGRIKHTASAERKLVDLKASIMRATEAQRALLAQYQRMADTCLTPEIHKGALDAVFPVVQRESTTGQTRTINQRNRVQAILNAGEYNTPQDGSVWGLFQAISAYASHESLVRGHKDASAQTARWLRSSIDGDATTEKAFQYLIRV
jgi:Domain of unknown function (DUF932)